MSIFMSVSVMSIELVLAHIAKAMIPALLATEHGTQTLLLVRGGAMLGLMAFEIARGLG